MKHPYNKDFWALSDEVIHLKCHSFQKNAKKPDFGIDVAKAYRMQQRLFAVTLLTTKLGGAFRISSMSLTVHIRASPLTLMMTSPLLEDSPLMIYVF